MNPNESIDNNDANNGPGSSPGQDQSDNGAAAKAPRTLADVVRATAKASAATGGEGLEGGGATPDEGAPAREGSRTASDDGADASGDVQLLDTTQDEAEGSVPEGDDAPDGTDVSTEEVETPPTDDTDKVVDNDKLLSFSKHPRFRELVTQKNEAERVLAEQKPFFDAQQSVVAFCQEHSITPEQYNEGLQLMAMINTDPAKAAEKLKGVMEVLRNYTADEVRSKDLLEAMEKGELTQAHALELERLRANTKSEGIKAQLQQRRATQQASQERTNTILAWDMATRKKDPSYKPKASTGDVDGLYEYVVNKSRELFSMAPPQTTAQAVAHCELAYKEGQRFFAARTPKPKTTRNGHLPSSRTSSANGRPAPKTLKDVVFGVANGTIKADSLMR